MAADTQLTTQINSTIRNKTRTNKIQNTEHADLLQAINTGKVNNSEITGFLNQTEVDARINALIPQSERVLAGGTANQVYSRTSSGYAWITLPAGTTPRTDGEINTLIDNRIPVAMRVASGGSNGQVYTRTSSGYTWTTPTDTNTQRSDSEINQLIDTRIPTSQRVLTGGNDGQIYSRSGANGYAWIDAPSGGSGLFSTTDTTATPTDTGYFFFTTSTGTPHRVTGANLKTYLAGSTPSSSSFT